VCYEPEDPGYCDNYVLNYSYDKATKSCKAFYYGGCDGNGNRFETKNECEKNCFIDDDLSWNSTTTPKTTTKSIQQSSITSTKLLESTTHSYEEHNIKSETQVNPRRGHFKLYCEYCNYLRLIR